MTLRRRGQERRHHRWRIRVVEHQKPGVLLLQPPPNCPHSLLQLLSVLLRQIEHVSDLDEPLEQLHLGSLPRPQDRLVFLTIAVAILDRCLRLADSAQAVDCLAEGG